MKRKFITFADSRMKKALGRICRQAEDMSFFDEIKVYTEKDLEESFLKENANLLRPGVRGYGYWKWKPYLIRRELQTLQEGDQLYYIDAGCHWNSAGRPRLLEYAMALEACPLGIAAFELGRGCSERAYTKMDVLVHMGVENNDAVLDRGQICGGHVFVAKNERSVAFVDAWYAATQNTHLIDDSPSVLPNLPEFKEHRHEQRIFSNMCKLQGALVFSGKETWPENNSRNWASLSPYPIWDKRDLGVTSHLFLRLWRKIAKKVKISLNFLKVHKRKG